MLKVFFCFEISNVCLHFTPRPDVDFVAHFSGQKTHTKVLPRDSRPTSMFSTGLEKVGTRPFYAVAFKNNRRNELCKIREFTLFKRIKFNKISNWKYRRIFIVANYSYLGHDYLIETCTDTISMCKYFAIIIN